MSGWQCCKVRTTLQEQYRLLDLEHIASAGNNKGSYVLCVEGHWLYRTRVICPLGICSAAHVHPACGHSCSGELLRAAASCLPSACDVLRSDAEDLIIEEAAWRKLFASTGGVAAVGPGLGNGQPNFTVSGGEQM